MFSTAQPMPGFGRLFAVTGAAAIAISAISFTAGVMVERHTWEDKTMGDLCGEGRQWACRLHPQCSMNALVCYSSEVPGIVKSVEQG